MTYVLAARIPELVKAVNKHEDVDSLFARNVRLEIRGSEVNAGIRATYEKDPQKFFFGNNGIHIVTTKANFGGGRVTIEQPAVINGGQTLKTLLSSSPRHREGRVLVRITEIPQAYQASEIGRKFVGDIIYMSNSNNKMEPWNLRSNDPVQIDIAKYFMKSELYYERKDYEWQHNRARYPQLSVCVSSVDLASAKACATDWINPAGLKTVGLQPLFWRNASPGTIGTKREGYYDRIFDSLGDNLPEALSLAKVYLIVHKWCRKVSGVPQEFKSFPGASANFVFGIVWRALEYSDIHHPYDLRIGYQRTCPRFGKEIHKLIRELFKTFKPELMGGKQQNDIFRSQECWKKALHRHNTRRTRTDIIKALERDINA